MPTQSANANNAIPDLTLDNLHNFHFDPAEGGASDTCKIYRDEEMTDLVGFTKTKDPFTLCITVIANLVHKALHNDVNGFATAHGQRYTVAVPEFRVYEAGDRRALIESLGTHPVLSNNPIVEGQRHRPNYLDRIQDPLYAVYIDQAGIGRSPANIRDAGEALELLQNTPFFEALGRMLVGDVLSKNKDRIYDTPNMQNFLYHKVNNDVTLTCIDNGYAAALSTPAAGQLDTFLARFENCEGEIYASEKIGAGDSGLFNNFFFDSVTRVVTPHNLLDIFGKVNQEQRPTRDDLFGANNEHYNRMRDRLHLGIVEALIYLKDNLDLILQALEEAKVMIQQDIKSIVKIIRGRGLDPNNDLENTISNAEAYIDNVVTRLRGKLPERNGSAGRLKHTRDKLRNRI